MQKRNQQQNQFVLSTSKNVLVSASAGSGKTSTMIDKLMQTIVEKRTDVKNLLVLTFTEAAASEMKQKLQSNLSAALKLVEPNSQEQQHLLRTLEDLNFADIGTFHSIFKRWITKYFYHLEIDPSFQVLTEHEVVLTQAVNRVFDDYVLSHDPAFYELQQLFTKKRSDNSLKESLTQIYLTSKEKLGFEQWFLTTLETTYNENLNQNQALTFLLEHSVKQLLHYEKQWKFLFGKVKQAQWQGVETYVSQFALLFEQLNKPSTNVELLQFLFGIGNFGTLRFPKEILPDWEELKTSLKNWNERFKKELATVKKQLITPSEEEHQTMLSGQKTLLLKLLEVLNRIEQEYKTMKNNKSQLDFNDLQQYTVELLKNPTVVEELSKHYQAIFVDEFQDVNEIQFAILNTISTLGQTNYIGDVKQSIYEFRLASPKIFLDQLNHFSSEANNGEVIYFNLNYRSSNHILQFVNFVCNTLITPQTIGIDYKNTSSLECGNKELLNYENNNPSTHVELALLRTDEEISENENTESETESDEETNSEEEDSYSNLELEAELVVHKLNQVFGKPFFNPKTNTVEKVNYKHIAILTRDSGEFASVLTQTLEKYKIPSYSTSKSNLFGTHAVVVLFSVLKLLHNPLDDYALATVMASQIGKFSYAELSQIRLTNNSKKVPFYECVLAFATQEEQTQLVLKVQQFLEMLNRYEQSLTYQTVYETLQALVAEFGLNQYFYSMPNGTQLLQNINEFLQLLNNEQFANNISACVHYLTQLSQKENFQISVSGGENAVTVLTMHKSKGLEWPVVILAQLGKSFNKSENKKDLNISIRFGVGMRYRDAKLKTEKATLAYNACLLDKQYSEQKEQIRLLYVALTRAKNELILVGTTKGKNMLLGKHKPVLQKSTFLELLLEPVSTKEVEELATNLDETNLLQNQFGTVKVTQFTPSGLPLNKQAQLENGFGTPQPEWLQLLQKQFAFVYQTMPNVSVKNSVTAMLQEQDYTLVNDQSKRLLVSEVTPSDDALELGVAYHAIMQQLNYNESQIDVEMVISNLVMAGKLSPQIAKKVNAQWVTNAIEKVQTLLTPNTKILKEKQFLLSMPHNQLVANSSVLEPVLVQGVIDLILLHGNHAVVIDFKTNKTHNKQNLIQNYALQLNIYGKAVQSGFGVIEVKKLLYSFELNEFVEVI